jgi:hypothetical protein
MEGCGRAKVSSKERNNPITAAKNVFEIDIGSEF